MNVVDVEAGRMLVHQDVLIRGETIVSVQPAQRGRRAGRRMSGRGRYLMPGLWDAHVHAFATKGEEDVALPLYLAHGVTSVRDVGSPRGRIELADVASDLAEGRRVGPTLVLADAAIDGPPGSWPGISVVATPEEGRSLVRRLNAEGWGSIKLYALLRPEVYAAVLDQARELGLPAFGHVPEAVTIREALAAGQAGFEHVDKLRMACSPHEGASAAWLRAALQLSEAEAATLLLLRIRGDLLERTFDEDRCRALLADLAAAKVWLTPTLVTDDFHLGRDPASDDERWRSVPAGVLMRWRGVADVRAGLSDPDKARAALADRLNGRVVRLAQDAGLTLLAGSDASFNEPYLFHGASLHDELQRLVTVGGLTPREALATATVNPGRLFGGPTQRGRVAAGQTADLVLLSGDPLADVGATRRITAVISRGRLLDRAALDDLLEAAVSARDKLLEPGEVRATRSGSPTVGR